MKPILRVCAAGMVYFLGALCAYAGLPLKGVDVKLGRNPGGNCASRVSNAKGDVDFGVWPKGSYSLSFVVTKIPADARAAKPRRLHVEIHGAAQGVITHVVPSENAEHLLPITIVSDGKTPIVVNVRDGNAEPFDAVRIKSHSNSTNN
ncbi:MAG: hypothetical protein KGN79_02595 [Acidobacteriota bacterium]|nr:hypothetical protein [Acidobacteriota bacterium]